MEQASREPRIGFDLESNGFFRYPERICLIQLSTSKRIYLLDPLAIDDMSPLGEVLVNPGVETVLHSGDHDIRSLDRDWGFHVGNLFDTSIAAAFVGSERLGLASTLQDFMGVTILKEKNIQRSDWSIRPLSDGALVYAAADVQHLFGLRDKASRIDFGRWTASIGSGRSATVSRRFDTTRPTPNWRSSPSEDRASWTVAGLPFSRR